MMGTLPSALRWGRASARRSAPQRGAQAGSCDDKREVRAAPNDRCVLPLGGPGARTPYGALPSGSGGMFSGLKIVYGTSLGPASPEV